MAGLEGVNGYWVNGMQTNQLTAQFQSSLEYSESGFCKPVALPVHGRQHLGHAPAGAMDLFSHSTANLLLDNPPDCPTLEIIIAPEIRFKKDCFFAVTGARYERMGLIHQNSGRVMTILKSGRVYLARKGSRLSLQVKILGFRTYLAVIPVETGDQNLGGRQRTKYDDLYSWADPDNRIRIIEGPEYRYLDDKEVFTRSYWTITEEFSEMGIRLSSRFGLPRVSLDKMVSQAVADGTIQLTPSGPIILLKHRQTVGGYPRIYNIISADVDLLGQYAPRHIIRFKKIDLDSARSIARLKQQALCRTVRD